MVGQIDTDFSMPPCIYSNRSLLLLLSFLYFLTATSQNVMYNGLASPFCWISFFTVCNPFPEKWVSLLRVPYFRYFKVPDDGDFTEPSMTLKEVSDSQSYFE